MARSAASVLAGLAPGLLAACAGPVVGDDATTPDGGTTMDGGSADGGETTDTAGDGKGWTGPCVFDLDCDGPCPTLAETYAECWTSADYTWVEDCITYQVVYCQGDVWGQVWTFVDDKLACWSRSTDSRDFCEGTSYTVTYGDCPAETTTCTKAPPPDADVGDDAGVRTCPLLLAD